MRIERETSRGFSLAELLTVLAIIGVLVTLSVPALRGVSETGSMTQAITRISGTLEQARNFAVANNTHTWVAFSDNALPGETGVRMVAFASQSGLNLESDSGGGVVRYPSEDVEMIAPIERIRQIRVGGSIPDDNALLSGQILPPVGEVTEFPTTSGGLQFSLEDEMYSRSIHFKPNGEAGMDVGVSEVIQIVVVPEKNPGGTIPEKDARQAMVIRVSGLTGQAIVYQPR